ncbi:MAG: PQQ-dependent sugar dehydrogenase [Acidobacteriota bacterium]|nr:PQQ-dependent sugar dehydrogenase [Acidobacteriota bacterium]
MNDSRTLAAEGFHFPTSLAFDESGTAYVAESGLTFDGAPAGGRVWRLAPDGSRTCLKDDLRPPVNGLTWHQGALTIAEGGNPGRISRLYPDGRWESILDGLPGGGNYHTNEVAYGPDGLLYFGQGAMTNSGVVGPDALGIGWLRQLEHPHDIPGLDIQLTGFTATVDHPGTGESMTTGAFAPFGKTSGDHIPGRLPCTAAVMRCRPDGTELELVAWGLRNPYGLGFLPDGRLLAVDLGINDRGSRPVGNVPDCIFQVEPGWWYGWPDYAAGKPVNHPDYRPIRGEPPEPLLVNHHLLPPLRAPLISFPVHAAPVKFTVKDDLLYVALFGDKLPLTGPPGPHAGRLVARVDLQAGTVERLPTGPFQRPIDVELNPADGRLYVLDFGNYEMKSMTNLEADAGSGKLWRLDLNP